MQKPTALCLVGPTASGKTRLAMSLADKRSVRLISVDSAQVYQGLDIGSGKPSAAELSQYPHELIDITQPNKPYSAYFFQQDALRLIEEALDQNQLPVLVGGTMMYFKALLHGFAELPGADEAVRKEIESRAAEQGWPALHKTLLQVDEATAKRLEPTDSQRIGRALEIYQLTGIPLSEWIKAQKPKELPFEPVCVGLAPAPGERNRLHHQIEKRFRTMLDSGLVEETKSLMAGEAFDPNLPAFRSVGYRQAIEALSSGDIDSLYEKGCAATRQLAKRQLTWMRSWEGLHWVDCFDTKAFDQVVEHLPS